MIKAIVFDCFGVVLTDALQELRSALQERDAEAARDVTDIVAANNRGLLPPKEASEQIASLLGVSVEEYRNLIQEREVRNAELLEYILELRSTYKIAMLSNIAGSSLQRRFPNDELSTYFDLVVASADIGFIKPEAEAYLHVAEQLQVEPEACVFVDDREMFCAAATSVGMHAIVYTNFVRFRRELESVLADSK